MSILSFQWQHGEIYHGTKSSRECKWNNEPIECGARCSISKSVAINDIWSIAERNNKTKQFNLKVQLHCTIINRKSSCNRFSFSSRQQKKSTGQLSTCEHFKQGKHNQLFILLKSPCDFIAVVASHFFLSLSKLIGVVRDFCVHSVLVIISIFKSFLSRRFFSGIVSTVHLSYTHNATKYSTAKYSLSLEFLLVKDSNNIPYT